jgi:hypothetical protein
VLGTIKEKKKKMKIRLTILFMILPFAIYSKETKIKIDTLTVISSKNPKEVSVHFHQKKCDIYFDKNEIIRVWKKNLKELDSIYREDISDWKTQDLNELTVGLDKFIRQEKWEFDVNDFENPDVIVEKNSIKLSTNLHRFIYEISSELLDEGEFRISSNKKTQEKIIKARVYKESYKSSTTYIKYYLQGMIEIWTGLPIIHDDFE